MQGKAVFECIFYCDIDTLLTDVYKNALQIVLLLQLFK